MRFFGELEGMASQLIQLSECPDRVRSAKPSVITRHVTAVLPLEPQICLAPDGVPKAGDVILARVDSVGTSDWLERPDGRRATLFVGDEIVVAYGARYATSVYGGAVPDDLGPCDLLTCGGMAGKAFGAHSAGIVPTRLSPIGLLADQHGRVVNVRDYAPVARQSEPPAILPTVIAVVGTSMDAGKTTVAGSLIRGLASAGLQVAAAKVSGTGLGKDRWHLADAGAYPVFDVGDAGMPSTHLVPLDERRSAYFGLLTAMSEAGPGVIVIEIAGGLGHVETAALVADEAVRSTLRSVVLAAGDALGALAGFNMLASWQLPVSAVSGVVTSSPLSQREAAALVNAPVISTLDLSDPAVAKSLISMDTEQAA